MPGLRVVTSNRLERLVSALAETVARPLAPPLEPEVIVVQSRGMERWLSLELSRRLGCWMNGRFPFPNAVVSEAFAAVLGAGPSERFAPEVLAWRVFALLPSLLDRPSMGRLRAYLGPNAAQRKAYDLAERLADTLDQYSIYRPELLLRWERGEPARDADEAWQAELWRELARGGEGHRAALRGAFLSEAQGHGAVAGLPARLSVFGIPALPPFHLEVLSALSRRVEVHLFLLCPCRQYWADLVRDPDAPDAPALLASWGRVGAEFQDALQDLGAAEEEAYVEPEGDSVLARLQADLLDAQAPAGGEPRWPVAPEDDSVRVHSCHGPLREVEVLHDRLLALFDEHPELEPRDVLVMTPDIETYAPLFQAVFSAQAEGVPRIPFSVADRSVRRASPLAAGLLAVLALAGTRFAAGPVLEVLEVDAVRRRFGLGDADVRRIRAWVRATRIRWGVDAETRCSAGLPEFEEHTWRAGLDRLLLGYAVPAGGGRLFAGVAPFDVEGIEAAESLGRLADFAEALFGGLAALGAPRSLSEWSRSLSALFEALFSPDEHDGVETLRGALHRLAALGQAAGFHGPVELDVVRGVLARMLEAAPLPGGFLAGGVTFCAMLPMRSIPFPVVCVLGLNDETYPRPTRTPGFDLMAREPRRGDRALRQEDRYVFLEALLSARSHLHLSYVGQSARDGSDVPPSVLVSELLEALAQRFEPALESPFLVRHRLQAFCPAYFRGRTELASYSAENSRASALLLAGAGAATLPFFEGPLPEPPEELRELDLTGLGRFFSNPCRALLAARLGLRFSELAAPVEEREPFALGGLERYGLAELLVEDRLAGRPPAAGFELARAEGLLPHGRVGECAFGELARDVEGFVALLAPRLAQGPPRSLDFEREVRGFRLAGRLEPVYPGGLVHYRPAAVKPVDRLRLWLQHLALNLVEGPATATFVGRGEAWSLASPADPEGLLASLLGLYWEGLARPLAFFPRASWAYAEARFLRGKDRFEALGRARTEWEGESRFTTPEGADASFALVFGRADPLDDAFEEAAEAVFAPLVAHLGEAP